MHRYTCQLMAGSAIGMVLAVIHFPAVAQEAPAIQLDRIDVRGQGGGESTADNSSTVDQEQLAQQSASKLDDVLRTVPGVFTRINAQQPGVAVNIRGFEGAGRVNMMIDGVRQSFRFTGHEAAGFTYIDPNLLAGVDITRGEVTTTGGGALAGKVNFRTLDVDDIVSPGKQWGGLARLNWGNNGVGFTEMLASGFRNERMGFAAAISKRNSDDYKDGDGNTVANTGQDLLSGLFKANFALTGEQSLSLGGVFYNNDFFANSYDQTVNNRTFTASYRYDPSSPFISLRVNAYLNDLEMEYTGGTGSYVGRKINDRGVGFDVSNTSLLSFGNIQVRSINGVEYFHDDVTSESGGVNPADGASSVGGVFTSTTFKYGLIDLTTGLRYNFYTLKGSGTLNNTYGDYNVDISEGSVDPKITLAFNLTGWLQPYVTWGRSMRAPTLQETMLGGSHPGTTTGSYVPNPYLKPETQQGWEFGLNLRKHGLWRAGDMLTARANYFIKDIENYIVASYNSNYGAYQFVNVAGSSAVQGFEFEVNYDARIVFAGISYTHTDSALPSQLSGLGASQYLPDDVLTVTVGARFLEDKLTLGGQVTYVSGGLVAGYNNTWTGGAASEGGDPYHLVSLFSNYKYSDSLDFNVKVTNLFDETYTPFLSTVGTGQGRTVYAGAQWKF